MKSNFLHSRLRGRSSLEERSRFPLQNAPRFAAPQYPLLRLQQVMGNRAVTQLLQANFKPGECQLPKQGEKRVLQGKSPLRITPVDVQGDGRAESPNGIPGPLKFGLEALSGTDLSRVRVHKNSKKPAEVNALAHTQGQDIHLGPGQEKHLPHEAWHAVQQLQRRVVPTMMVNGVSINDNEELEREADEMGVKATQLKQSPETNKIFRRNTPVQDLRQPIQRAA